MVALSSSQPTSRFRHIRTTGSSDDVPPTPWVAGRATAADNNGQKKKKLVCGNMLCPVFLPSVKEQGVRKQNIASGADRLNHVLAGSR